MAHTPIGAGAYMPFEGRLFGGYRIARPIATGGMATVYLARKTGPGRYAQTAAIKIIHPHMARNRELAEMFMDEARLASCINHPSVCRVLDFGEAEGTYFLAMEYVRGESWASVLHALASHPLTQPRLLPLSLYVLAQACEGLHAIHEAIGPDGLPLNIVHRDVSPQNLLVAYDGSVRLLDFGIASAEGRAHTGSTEVVRGRYAYMAPEQMRGQEVDRRADIWSLGVMLYEALSGYNPFIRDTQIATMLGVTQEPLPTWPPGTAPVLRQIAELTLARAPEDRFATARELGDALTRYLTSHGESALHAELSRHMRELFAQQIAEKRAALRELSGEDGQTETFPSGYPAVKPSATPLRALEPEPAPRRRPTRKALLAGLGLFALSSVGSWYVTHREPLTGSAGAIDAARAAHEPSEPPAPLVERSASATPPETAPAAASPEPQTPPAASESAAVSGAETGERRHHHHRHRSGSADETKSAVASTPAPAEAEPAEPVERAQVPGGPPGTLVVGASQGWAVVFEGRQKLGTTPMKIDLPSGSHTLIVRPYGEGSPRRVRVDVKPGETAKLRIDL